MIDTEIFGYSGLNNYTTFNEILKEVNNLIKEKNIKRDDILEYCKENFS